MFGHFLCDEIRYKMTPPITIEALLVLDAIAERGSYASAAEQLNKVPSALSYIMQKLEEQLGVTLFQRQGRRSVLTPAGKHLLAEGRNILLAINKLSEQTQIIANGWEPKIRIAIDSIIDGMDVFPIIKQFVNEHPNIEIDISEEVLNGAWEALIDDRVELLIGASAPVPIQKGVSVQTIAMNEMAFYVNKNHPLLSYPAPLSDQNIARFVTVVVHDSAKTVIPKSVGIIENSQHLYVASLDHKIKAIISGLGCGFLPKKRAQSYVQNGQLIALETEHVKQPDELYIAWKFVNRGKGLQRLRELLLNANLAGVL